MKPFFTIIIPTLNEEKFVGKLLSDLSKQTYSNFEVLVVDALSKDKTVNEVKKYRSFFTKLRTLSVREKNVSRQRNYGALAARGSQLVFLDADSRIGKFFLSKLFSYINKHKGLLFLPGISSSKQDPQMNIAVDFSNAFVALSNKIGRPFSTGGSMIVEKNFFHHIGGFPEDVHMSEDHLLVQNAYKHGVSARFLSSIRVKISLRRYKREGKLEVFFKYMKSTIYFLAKGKVDKKIIEYEMGGHLYGKKSKKALKDFIKINPSQLIKGFNKNIRMFIRGLDI